MAGQIKQALSSSRVVPQSKANAILPWAAASLVAMVIGDAVIHKSTYNPKQYIGWAFVYLVILLLPEQIGAVFAPLIFIGILVAHHEFLTGLAKR